MTEGMQQQAANWPVVQTDAGPVTLVSVQDLRSRADQWRGWIAQATASALSLRTQAVESLAQAGAILVDHRTEWSAPPELASQVEAASELTHQVAADDASTAQLKEHEHAENLLTRAADKYRERQVGHDRDKLAAQLRGLQITLAQQAPATSVIDAETQRKAASDLEERAAGLDTEIKSAEAWAEACDAEVARRTDAIKSMGFDSLYEAAQLQTSGASTVDSPLVLKAGERAYLSVPATLARMVSRTHYVGGSSGFSFPIGHTGIRYRVGSFHGQPVHQESLTKLDSGTFVLTNQRIAYVGRTKSTSASLSKVLHVEVYNDAISIAREGRENPDFYLMGNPKRAVFLINWVLSHGAS